MADRCEHVEGCDPSLNTGVEVCEECVKTGGHWVHLRVCKTCGHVGCCDSSPNRHARAHYEETGHPVIGPAESWGGDWLWCYPDDTYVKADGSTG